MGARAIFGSCCFGGTTFSRHGFRTGGGGQEAWTLNVGSSGPTAKCGRSQRKARLSATSTGVPVRMAGIVMDTTERKNTRKRFIKRRRWKPSAS